jgi:hypothetical protein
VIVALVWAVGTVACAVAAMLLETALEDDPPDNAEPT